MNVLIVKTSSMGDVLHTLPALTDAQNALPEISFDWVVEEGFQEIPGWHYAVDRTIVIALRRWHHWLPREGRATLGRLRARRYHRIIDAQGLIKSALVAGLARGPVYGMSFDSAREPAAALCYRQRFSIPRDLHAVTRTRRLFAFALGYEAPQGPADYGVRVPRGSPPAVADARFLVFAHGTTWASKQWPPEYWRQLTRCAEQAGLRVLLPWNSADERARAEDIAKGHANAALLPKSTLGELASVLSKAAGVVAVDTGLGHLCAALSVPCVSIYGSTNAGFTGTLGAGQEHLEARFECAPCLRPTCAYTGAAAVSPACYATVPASLVWSTLQSHL